MLYHQMLLLLIPVLLLHPPSCQQRCLEIFVQPKRAKSRSFDTFFCWGFSHHSLIQLSRWLQRQLHQPE